MIRLGWHRLRAVAAAVRFGFPARKLTVIGVTGTDGKTTTVGMIAHILQEAGVPAGALSTAFFSLKGKISWNATQKTSPSPFIIQGFLRRLVREGCTHAVLEYSSHGLVQHRTAFTRPRVAAVTNTTPEHLDYHGTMEQYRKDKGKLFSMLRGRGCKVLNAEDESFAMYKVLPSGNTIAYGKQGIGEIVPANETIELLEIGEVKRSPEQSECVVIHTILKNAPPCPPKLPEERRRDPNPLPSYPLTLPLPGSFNLENALCAMGSCLGIGIPVEVSCKALASFKGVPGRMERIDEGQPFSVFVDFTVTPGAYEKTLSAIRAMLEPGKRLLVLTGSCGDRMREKRPLVGRICSDLADVVVVTNEDPYTEDPQKIIDEVWRGIDAGHCEAHKIFDRKEAMRFLFQKAQPGDAVILCAKGSDTTMWTAKGQVPWDEREIARSLLERNSSVQSNPPSLSRS